MFVLRFSVPVYHKKSLLRKFHTGAKIFFDATVNNPVFSLSAGYSVTRTLLRKVPRSQWGVSIAAVCAHAWLAKHFEKLSEGRREINGKGRTVEGHHSLVSIFQVSDCEVFFKYPGQCSCSSKAVTDLSNIVHGHSTAKKRRKIFRIIV